MRTVFFFIGTEAELIKVFPVIISCMERGICCNIIASGQNDIKKSRILQEVNINGTFLELSEEKDIKKSAAGLLQWFFRTKKCATNKILEVLSAAEIAGAPFIVHGDTVSTYMGALIGKKLEATVCHVEAGLRSHHLFNPFPEEIDRLLTSRIARVHFAPGSAAVKNLRRARGEVVNTEYNTILDSLNYSKGVSIKMEKISAIQEQPYFVFVMHRQENLMKKDFVKKVLQNVEAFSQRRKCVLILHKITENTLKELNLLEGLKKNDNFILLPRVDYFDFMKLLNGADFVITDGGSNQEELCYMGKPCLIMRKTTERQEGIGENAILYGGDIDMMCRFEEDYQRYCRPSLIGDYQPSKKIAEVIERYADNN